MKRSPKNAANAAKNFFRHRQAPITATRRCVNRHLVDDLQLRNLHSFLHRHDTTTPTRSATAEPPQFSALSQFVASPRAAPVESRPFRGLSCTTALDLERHRKHLGLLELVAEGTQGRLDRQEPITVLGENLEELLQNPVLVEDLLHKTPENPSREKSLTTETPTFASRPSTPQHHPGTHFGAPVRCVGQEIMFVASGCTRLRGPRGRGHSHEGSVSRRTSPQSNPNATSPRSRLAAPANPWLPPSFTSHVLHKGEDMNGY